jgi:peptidoglycan hydrolase-like protein with peptidoglycan-binding domain
MFLVSKSAWAGIIFILLTTWISGPRPAPVASGPNLSKELPAVEHPNDVNRIQQTLLDKGHYSGKVDGVFGLRTRASIRRFQEAENLPVTGQLDTQTAGRLGVTPESHNKTGRQITQGKPSAGIEWVGRRSKPLRKAVKRVASLDSGRSDPEKALQAENDKNAQ